MKANTAGFGQIEVPIKDKAKSGAFVPTLIPYTDHDKILESIAFAIQMNIACLLIGETGVGKTAAVRHIAARTNNDLRRVNVNGSMTAEDFVGQLLVDKTGTYWKDGVLIECMRNGYWLVIDEINAASAEILFVLHSLLDDDRYVVLTDHPQREIVKAHPDFRIFATMNPPERYSGTKEMNKALLSRFGMTLTVGLPPEDIEFGDISKAIGTLDKTEVKGLKSFVAEMRNAYNKEEMEVFVSPRDIAHIVQMYLFTGNLIEAVEKTIAPRGTKAESTAIMNLARLHLAKRSPKAGAAADGADEDDRTREKKRMDAMMRAAAKAMGTKYTGGTI